MHSIQLLIVIAILLLVECDELLLLQAIWRHGDRSPIQSCKGYPIQTQHWPQGKGQLTAVSYIIMVLIIGIILIFPF
uniref:Bm738 n=1 Tax=Brugia malayi TaxID=6279 RepID=A0A1I9G5G6_BRUMA|nr:Bm738 [Brugia malayi]